MLLVPNGTDNWEAAAEDQERWGKNLQAEIHHNSMWFKSLKARHTIISSRWMETNRAPTNSFQVAQTTAIKKFEGG